MNTKYFRPRNDPYSNFYNLGWNNHFDFSWQIHAIENYALQCHELHNQAYP